MPATIRGDQAGTVGLINAGTAQNSTSGTSIDFTGIPAGVKRITVMFNGVSTNGSSMIQIQLGASSFSTSGYASSSSTVGAGNITAATNSSTGILVAGGAASIFIYGSITLKNFSGNIWVGDGVIGRGDASYSHQSGGAVGLSGTLDRVRITTVNGTDTFDAGSINILYE